MKYDINRSYRHTRKKLSAIVAGVMASAFAATIVLSGSGASAAPMFTVSPWVYDPNNACPGIVSEWDNAIGNPAPSVHLTKPCTTATEAASGATVNGVSGITLNELDFEFLNGSHCGAGAPRYNVYTADGYYFFGCSYGDQTVNGTWTHVEFTDADAVPATGSTPAWPGFGNVTITGLEVVFDEGVDQGTGSAYLDNFSINGQVVGGTVSPTSKDACKNGGWMTLQDSAGNTFKNQGDCVSYVATKGKNPAASGPAKTSHVAFGDVILGSPTQMLSFDTHDNGASATDTGFVTYSNPGASLTYTANVTCTNVVGTTAYFAYQIPAGNPYSGTWVVWRVVDNSPDTAGFSTAADMAAANTLCQTGFTPANSYPITAGDVIVH